MNRIGLGINLLISSCGSREPTVDVHSGVGVRGAGVTIGVGVGRVVSVGGSGEAVGVGIGSWRDEQAAIPKKNAARRTDATA